MPVCLIASWAVLASAGLVFADTAEWANWRGPNQDGSVTAQGLFDADNVGLKVEWSRTLGSGYSGIVVTGGRALTMFSDGEFDYLVALDSATGEEAWRYEIDTMYAGHDGSDDGPIGSPAVDDGIVYGLGPKGKLFAVSFDDGSEIWSVRLEEELKATAPSYGFTTTPLVVDGVLFVQTGGSEGRSHSGFDKSTGKLLWSTGDDVIGYQSPVVATLAGRQQIVAVGNKTVLGLDPASGGVLWSHEFTDQQGDGSTNPVVVGGDRVLLTAQRDSVLLRLEKSSDGFEVDEVWRTQTLKGSFAAPVYHDGHFYGFDGNFLTCVNAETGEKVWKSRPPGGLGLILVDDHLAIFAPKGLLVVAKATPDGYSEVASVEVSERGSYTWPSFAEGDFFVRNLADIAKVGITEAVASREIAEKRPPASRFESFVWEVEGSDNKRALIDDFMNSQQSVPVLEGNLVHFVYRGSVEDIAITGSMTEYFLEEPMERVEGTDLYYKTYEIAPGARWEYQYNVDFENLGPDPANPRRVPGIRGDTSEVLTPAYVPAAHVNAYHGDSPGTLETFQHKSEILESEREIAVYLPSGYTGGDDAYPLLIVTEGDEWLQYGNMTNSLNNLIGSTVAPVVVAFVGNNSNPQEARAELNGAKVADYVRMLTDELVPYLQERYRVVDDDAARAVMGYGSGGQAAARAALVRPDVFGKSAVQSAYLPDQPGEELLELAGEKTSSEIRFLVYWNRYELAREEFGFDLAVDSRNLAEALKTGGHDVAGGEVLDAAGWGSWRARLSQILEDFYPKN
jgi:outer membrane protein assembly factor BamB